MKKCPACGRERNGLDMKCPECGSFYSKITELIAEEEEQEEMRTFSGRIKKILNSEDVKGGLLSELRRMKAGLTKSGMFALFVIFVFVFALMASVL